MITNTNTNITPPSPLCFWRISACWTSKWQEKLNYAWNSISQKFCCLNTSGFKKKFGFWAVEWEGKTFWEQSEVWRQGAELCAVSALLGATENGIALELGNSVQDSAVPALSWPSPPQVLVLGSKVSLGFIFMSNLLWTGPWNSSFLLGR